jgi:diaminopimelate decarboxylase
MLSAFFQKHQNSSTMYFPDIAKNHTVLCKILNQYPTPFFLTQLSIVKDRLNLLSKSLKKSWPGKSKIAYSLKTNYSLIDRQFFDFVEVVSTNELEIALKSGYSYSHIIFNGTDKGKLDILLSKPVTLNLDNQAEIDQLLSYPKTIKSKIGIRLNTSINPSRFGFNIESGEAKNVISSLNQHHLPFNGLHIHLGSDIHHANSYQQVSEKVVHFITSNRLYNLDYLDFGGGFPAHGILPGSDIQSNPDITQYLKSIIHPILKSNIPQPLFTMILEPGRYIIDDATILIGKVINQKFTDNQTVNINVSVNMLPSVWYRKQIVQAFSSKLIPIKIPERFTTIYGNTCQESDCLFRGQLPELSIDDLIVFYCVGAYNQSQCSDFIFPKPKTFFID